MGKSVEIELLFGPECGSRDETVAMVQWLTRHLSVEAIVKERLISTPAEAVEQKFLGSPSIRVNGIDIDPQAANKSDFGLG